MVLKNPCCFFSVILQVLLTVRKGLAKRNIQENNAPVPQKI
jgi:hypothetical protein